MATGGLYTIRLVALDAEGGWGVIEARDQPARESPCAITLAQAILKGDRMSWLVQKATELGVARIVPMETDRVVARPAGEGAPRQTRWARIAREAVKQCGRVVVPGIDPPRAFAEVLAEVASHDAAWICWEGGGQTLVEAAQADPADPAPAPGRPGGRLHGPTRWRRPKRPGPAG